MVSGKKKSQRRKKTGQEAHKMTKAVEKDMPDKDRILFVCREI